MEDCPICYEAVDKSTGHCTLACNHSFHINCLTTWSAKEPTCPMCRHELGEKEVAVKREPPARWSVTSMSTILTEQPNSGSNLFGDIIENIIHNGPTQPDGSRRIHIGNAVFVTESDVRLVMDSAEVSKSIAIQELRRWEGDVVDAIHYLCQNRPIPPQPATPPTAHDIMSGPSDDQTLRWALWRMFDGVNTEPYYWNSYADVMHRSKFFYTNETWIHKDIHDICDSGMVSRGYESA